MSFELWQLLIAIAIGYLAGTATAPYCLKFFMRFAYGLMNMGKEKKC